MLIALGDDGDTFPISLLKISWTSLFLDFDFLILFEGGFLITRPLLVTWLQKVLFDSQLGANHIATAVDDAYDEWILSRNAEVRWIESLIYYASIRYKITILIDFTKQDAGKRRCFEQQQWEDKFLVHKCAWDSFPCWRAISSY